MDKNAFLQYVGTQFDASIVSIDAAAIAALDLSGVKAELVPARLPFSLSSTPTRAELLAGIRYFLAMTSLQYRFWHINGETGAFERYQYNGKVGSSGLTLAFDTAWGNGLTPGEALERAACFTDDVYACFGDSIPDPVSRRDVLANTLWGGCSQKTIELVHDYIVEHGRVDVPLAALVAQRHAPAYGDPFLKKAMLFLGFVASLMRTAYPVKDELCAFADYQVPRVLRHRGVLVYSAELAAAIEARQLIKRGSPQEQALRAATVLACEQLGAHHGRTPAEVDWWCFCQRNDPQAPFHLTETICY